MHATERETMILTLLERKGFITFRDLEKELDASPATLRRDLERLSEDGKIRRVHGGARLAHHVDQPEHRPSLTGVPFHENIHRRKKEKEAIGRAAASLCERGEGVIIDGGSTTLQMCPHLEGLELQVLTNSLHIVSALLPQLGTRIILPGGAVFREQNIILSAGGDDLMPRFHAPKLFMGAASVGRQGVMQADIVLVAAERRFIDRSEELILLVDSSKFAGSSGNVVCALEEVHTVVTDDQISDQARKMIEDAGVKLVVA